MIDFKDLNLEFKQEVKEFKCGDLIISVLQYLPIDDKTKLIQYVVNASIDETTGCASPLRVETYFGLGICSWYAGIEFNEEDNFDPGQTYDLLESNGIISQIMNKIPTEELEFIQDLVNDTIADIVRYNNSAAGIIQAMSSNAQGLDNNISDILEKIKNGEGLETLSVIKDVVGTD